MNSTTSVKPLRRSQQTRLILYRRDSRPQVVLASAVALAVMLCSQTAAAFSLKSDSTASKNDEIGGQSIGALLHLSDDDVDSSVGDDLKLLAVEQTFVQLSKLFDELRFIDAKSSQQQVPPPVTSRRLVKRQDDDKHGMAQATAAA